MEKTGEKREKMERHNGQNRRKDVETKKPRPQRCLCYKGIYADTKKGGEDKERSVKREEISLEMQCLLLWFWGFVFIVFFNIITDFSGISVFSSD